MNCSKDCKQLLGLCIYSKIALIQHPWVRTGAVLLDIPDYQTVPILTSVLTGNVLLLLLCMGY